MTFDGRSPAGTGSKATIGTTPIIIGGLAKGCYTDFVTYVRGAITKLLKNVTEKRVVNDENIEPVDFGSSGTEYSWTKLIHERLSPLSDEQIAMYETQYRPRKKHISMLWSLMAFSAQVVEALMVVDRWAWLKEQDCVGEAWVQSVFEYGTSPRNMVVVGVRKED